MTIMRKEGWATYVSGGSKLAGRKPVWRATCEAKREVERMRRAVSIEQGDHTNKRVRDEERQSVLPTPLEATLMLPTAQHPATRT